MSRRSHRARRRRKREESSLGGNQVRFRLRAALTGKQNRPGDKNGCRSRLGRRDDAPEQNSRKDQWERKRSDESGTVSSSERRGLLLQSGVDDVSTRTSWTRENEFAESNRASFTEQSSVQRERNHVFQDDGGGVAEREGHRRQSGCDVRDATGRTFTFFDGERDDEVFARKFYSNADE